MSSVSSTTGPQQLLTPEGQTLLAGTDEFDYLTHIVFRMYENKTVSSPRGHPGWVGLGCVISRQLSLGSVHASGAVASSRFEHCMAARTTCP